MFVCESWGVWYRELPELSGSPCLSESPGVCCTGNYRNYPEVHLCVSPGMCGTGNYRNYPEDHVCVSPTGCALVGISVFFRKYIYVCVSLLLGCTALVE